MLINIICRHKKMFNKESRALIIQPGALGDGILTLPLVRLLLRVQGICHVDILGHHQNGHYNLIKRFIQSLKDNTELPVAVAEVRAMMRLYDAITSQIPTKS